jgi:segregation and condensation protein A
LNSVTFRLEAFEGPLDLLLHLISVNKVQIDDIPIADILSQYMDYLESMASFDMEITSDFLVMAAQLVLIKSRLLLPRPKDSVEEDPRMSLAQRLAVYQQFKEAALLLRPMSEAGCDYISRLPSPLQTDKPYNGRHHASLLTKSLSLLLGREKPKPPAMPLAFSHALTRKHIRVEDEAKRVLALLTSKGQMTLSEAFSGVTDRVTAVATFLALLDLCQKHHIYLAEDNTIATGSSDDAPPPSDEKELVIA